MRQRRLGRLDGALLLGALLLGALLLGALLLGAVLLGAVRAGALRVAGGEDGRVLGALGCAFGRDDWVGALAAPELWLGRLTGAGWTGPLRLGGALRAAGGVQVGLGCLKPEGAGCAAGRLERGGLLTGGEGARPAFGDARKFLVAGGALRMRSVELGLA